ncbi:MAG: ThuA domain-containing protein [Saprospiraceae bacterium]|nr:ThuA domain-containing protein [Saprospiraceae bacterium]
MNNPKYISFILISAVILIFAIIEQVFSQDTIRILHYTETTGFNHNTKTESKNLFLKICDSLTANTSSYWTITSSDSSEVFDDLNTLQKFRVVIWSNTSGDSGLTTLQQENYEQYVYAGGNYLGIHAASDTYRHSSANGNNTGVWDFYAETLSGCSVQENPNHTSANHNNDMSHQTNHPTLHDIPNPWNKTEEYYYWENGYLSTGFSSLLLVNSTGSNSYDASRMTSHIKEHDWGSRSFYTSLGHSANDYVNDLTFENLLKNALLWTAHQENINNTHENDFFVGEIYPNPFSTYINLANLPDENSSLVIYDLKGKEVFIQSQIIAPTIDLSFLENGIYLIVVNSKNGLNRKMMVKH